MNKLRLLGDILNPLDDVVIPVSGGLDSTFLLYFFRKSFPFKRVIPVHFYGPTFYEEDRNFLEELSLKLKLNLRTILFNPLEEKWYKSEKRCFFCKRWMAERLEDFDSKYILFAEVSGENLKERPGFYALNERKKILFPLLDAGISKKDIISYFKEMGEENLLRNKNSCLLTRFPDKVKVTLEMVERVKRCEVFLREIGFKGDVRVRYLGDGGCLIEISKDEMVRKILHLIKNDELKSFFHKNGFEKIYLNLKGYGER